MSSLSRFKEFTYNFRAANMSENAGSFYEDCRLRLEPPDDLLEWKKVRTHVILQMDPTRDDKRIMYAGLSQSHIRKDLTDVQAYNRNNPDVYLFPLDVAADANNVVEFELDVTSGLHPSLRNFAEITMHAPVIPGSFDSDKITEVLLWKIDALYTTLEIR